MEFGEPTWVQRRSLREILKARDWSTRNEELLFGEVLLRIPVVSEMDPKTSVKTCVRTFVEQSVQAQSEPRRAQVSKALTNVYLGLRQELPNGAPLRGGVPLRLAKHKVFPFQFGRDDWELFAKATYLVMRLFR